MAVSTMPSEKCNYKIIEHSKSNVTISALGNLWENVDISVPSGYKPISIVHYYLDGGSLVYPYYVSCTSQNQVSFAFKNLSSDSITFKIEVKVLCLKTA